MPGEESRRIADWMLMKGWVKKALPQSIRAYVSYLRERWMDKHARKSYSQEGEDMLLERFLEQRHSGFYIDVGAHHPKRFSNTYRLYCRGWRGLNIDANPGSMALFDRLRPRDINVQAAVSFSGDQLTYYVFNEPALNTFSESLALERASQGYPIIKQIDVLTAPLGELLDRYVPDGTKIDLLSIDVEGLDYDVLQSNNWNLYTPEFILVECLDAATLAEAASDPVAQFLCKLHYVMVAKTTKTVLFRLEQLKPGKS